jgi:dienelactone hydrolase
MMTSNCVAAISWLQSYVVTLAWMGMQCGGTCTFAMAEWQRALAGSSAVRCGRLVP